MSMIIILAAFIGLIFGIKLTFLTELLIVIAALIITYVVSRGAEIAMLFYSMIFVAFVAGIIAGDIFVIFAYPQAREQAFSNVSCVCKWMFTPSYMETNNVKTSEEKLETKKEKENE